MTVKDGVTYVDEAVDSIFSTFPFATLIIVDDGSVKQSRHVLKQMAEGNDKIKLIVTDGIGRGRALNLALSKVETDFVANLDADDTVLPGAYNSYKLMRASKMDVAVVSGKIKVLDGFVDQQSKGSPEKGADLCITTLMDVGPKLYLRNYVSHVTPIMRLAALREVNGYDGERENQFDYDLWVRLYRAGYKIAAIDTVVGGKRIHEHQSFEHKRHAKYVMSSNRVRLSAAISPMERILVALVNIAHLAWAVIPRPIRFKIKAIFNK